MRIEHHKSNGSDPPKGTRLGVGLPPLKVLRKLNEKLEAKKVRTRAAYFDVLREDWEGEFERSTIECNQTGHGTYKVYRPWLVGVNAK